MVAAACGSPSEPTPPPVPGPPSPSSVTLTGRLVGTVTNEPIANATVRIGAESLTTNASGEFTLTSSAASDRTIIVSGTGLVTRESRVAVDTRNVTIDVIQDKPPFDLFFFRTLTRNRFETEGGLEPLRPLRAAPRIHIRTVDEAGRSIDSRTLNLVENALRDSGAAWSGGRFPIQVIERGSNSRLGHADWINVIWPAETDRTICGRATLGTRTGYIELQYRNEDCQCGARNLLAPMIVRHELGHVYGYWHTGSTIDVMYGGEWPERLCNHEPSDREIAHAKYMYAREPGNLDPDKDPSGTLLSEPRVIVIDD
jgi:hypothetical protein